MAGRSITLLAIEKVLSPAPGHPARQHSEGQSEKLNISVIFTSVEPTLAALQEAGERAYSLGARIKLLVPQVVPYPLSLETPPVLLDFNENRFRVLAGETPVETSVHIYLCRDRFETLALVLEPGSIVVLGGRKRWWSTPEQRLARRLRHAGCEVLFKETR